MCRPSAMGLWASRSGAVAQLVERLVRNEEVRGSTPLGSTRSRNLFNPFDQRWVTGAPAGRILTGLELAERNRRLRSGRSQDVSVSQIQAGGPD